jgi:FMN phosphatase YigB (HAD superfamily)
MPITTLLFDLDDTLLGNDFNKFIKPYIQSLSAHAATLAHPQTFASQMMAGVQAMIGNTDPRITLKEAFGNIFYPGIGLSEATMLPNLNAYYEQVHPALKSETQVIAAAREAVAWAFKAGYQVVIATNALFPRAAILQRLDWAGVSASEFPYALITTFEDMHFAKPSPEYYAEILARLEVRPEEAMMIGNDWEQDIEPAQTLGIRTWWATATGSPRPNANPTGIGTLEDFLSMAHTPGHLESLPEMPATPRGLRAQQVASLAVMLEMTKTLPNEIWRQRPSETEWSLGEIACHLRDVELEICLPRLRNVLDETNPFISAIDADTWAAERDYRSQSGPAAMAAYADARMATIALLDSMTPDQWQRPARHAVFGPTSLRELVSFTNEHDRLHIQQIKENLGMPVL